MKAVAMIERVDKERAEHCKQYVGAEWLDMQHYHLALDSSIISTDEAAELVARLARDAYPEAALVPTPEKPHHSQEASSTQK